MKPAGRPECDRREWIRRATRSALLAGMAVLSAGLIVRRVTRRCPNDVSVCQECRLAGTCSLPRAAAARRTSLPRRKT